MNEKQKNILDRNRRYIHEKLDTSSLFLSYLVSESILKGENRDKINGLLTSDKKARYFYQILIHHKKEEAYNCFLKALIHSDQVSLAEFLDESTTKQLQEQTSLYEDSGYQDENIIQSLQNFSMFDGASCSKGNKDESDNKSDDPFELIIKKIKEDIIEGPRIFEYSIDYRTPDINNDLDPYPLNNYKIRGVVYILNIMTYTDSKHKERIGSDVDVENIQNLFQKMGYTVEIIKEKKIEEIKEKMNQIASDSSLNDVGLLAMFLMSHGQDRIILDEDCKLMNINEVFINPFLQNKCTQLAGKPKLFFVQACRGDNLYFDNVPVDQMNEPNTEYKKGHPKSNFFMFFSTPEDYKSARLVKGSIFIRCLVLTISHFCHRYHLGDIALTVINIMDSLPIKTSEGATVIQIPTKESTSLGRHLYFFPQLEERKQGKKIDSSKPSTFICSCGQDCTSRIGLISHSRRCSKKN